MSVSVDSFLGGRLHIKQPTVGFRAGIDAVLLAAACPARPGDHVLDLGCGVGTAGLCLARRVPVHLTGVELQAEYAELARDNAALNGVPMQVFCADIQELPAPVKARRFGQVIVNPPYLIRSKGKPSAMSDRDMALAGQTPLCEWLSVASKRLRPGGWLTIIQHIARLPEILSWVPSSMGTISVTPVTARRTRAPHLLLMRAKKEGRGEFILHPAFVMHEGDRHLHDGDDFTQDARKILRNGAQFPWGD